VTGHWRSRDIAAGRIANQSRHITNQEDNRVPEILEVLHLPQQHSMSEVKIGSCGIEAGLNAKRPSKRKAIAQVFLTNEFSKALF
jgi:hypothetical protein